MAVSEVKRAKILVPYGLVALIWTFVWLIIKEQRGWPWELHHMGYWPGGGEVIGETTAAILVLTVVPAFLLRRSLATWGTTQSELLTTVVVAVWATLVALALVYVPWRQLTQHFLVPRSRAGLSFREFVIEYGLIKGPNPAARLAALIAAEVGLLSALRVIRGAPESRNMLSAEPQPGDHSGGKPRSNDDMSIQVEATLAVTPVPPDPSGEPITRPLPPAS